jgi:transcriptional regulator GlxA family with amidase domain
MHSLIGRSWHERDLKRGSFSVFAGGVTDALTMRNYVNTDIGQPPLLRRAVAYIHENAHHDITVNDIAAAVNVTPRSVQYTFRRHLGMTPLEYLRRIRLDGAHRELQAADPSVDTVMAIAGRWGFSHAGRFSRIYKQTFGTPPSRTLRGW